MNCFFATKIVFENSEWTSIKVRGTLVVALIVKWVKGITVRLNTWKVSQARDKQSLARLNMSRVSDWIEQNTVAITQKTSSKFVVNVLC